MPRKRLPLGRNEHELQLVDAWASAGLSRRTMSLYLTAVRRIQTWCSAHDYDLATLPPHALIDYTDTLPRTWSSRRRLRSALKNYWDATGRADAPTGAVRVPTQPAMVSKALDEGPAAELARAAALRGDKQGLAVLIALYLGLRRAEIASLGWPQFDAQLAWVRVVGKGDVTADLPVHPVLQDALLRFPRGGTEWLFPGRTGPHVTPTTIWTWTRLVAQEAKLRPVPPHVLRHTCLTTANDATGDLRAVQAFARHARPETTAGYTRVNRKRMLGVMLSLDFDAAAEAAS